MKSLKIILPVCCLLSAGWLGAKAQKTQKALYSGPLGVEIYTYRAAFNTRTAEVLDTIKALGITELEAARPKGMEASTFKKMCEARGISIPSTWASYDVLVRNPDSVALEAKALGASYLMVGWISHAKEFTVADVRRAAADFNRFGKVLKEHGVTFCYHVHGYEFGPWENGTLVDYLIKLTDPRYVSLEVDVVWVFHGGGDPAKFMEKYASRCKLIHLKDLRKGVANDLTGKTKIIDDVPLGTGQLDLPAIIQAARRIPMAHYFIEDESPNHAAQLPLSIAYLRGSAGK